MAATVPEKPFLLEALLVSPGLSILGVWFYFELLSLWPVANFLY